MRVLRHSEFEIGVPDGWLDRSLVILRPPDSDHLAPSITVSRQPLSADISSEEFAIQQIPALTETFAEYGFRIIEERQVRLAGLDAFRYAYEFTSQESNLHVIQIQIYLIRNGFVYVLTATDDAERFHDHKSALEDAIAHFNFAT